MQDQNKIPLLAVVGPTAGGKTALAVQLAHKLGGEIVSCDSMQVYRGMDVGTAKPTMDERGGVPHHLLDVALPDEPFSCAEYVKAAAETIREIHRRGKLPILCGGTGLYLDALLRGNTFEETTPDPELRQSLFDYAKEHGNRALHDLLAEADPESAKEIHENNVKRVVRALEIYRQTGKTKTQADIASREAESPYAAIVFGLCYEDRALLYRRIDGRVDEMLAAGLVEETRRLCDAGVFERNLTAAQAIGYKELLPYLRGEESLAFACERLKTATRHYAKRQLTWFGAKKYVQWVPMEIGGVMRSTEDVLSDLLAIWQARGETSLND